MRTQTIKVINAYILILHFYAILLQNVLVSQNMLGRKVRGRKVWWRKVWAYNVWEAQKVWERKVGKPVFMYMHNIHKRAYILIHENVQTHAHTHTHKHARTVARKFAFNC